MQVHRLDTRAAKHPIFSPVVEEIGRILDRDIQYWPDFEGDENTHPYYHTRQDVAALIIPPKGVDSTTVHLQGSLISVCKWFTEYDDSDTSIARVVFATSLDDPNLIEKLVKAIK